MTPGRDPAGGDSGPAGEQPHIPVLLDEVVRHMAPAENDRIIDGTFGAGGYTKALLDAAPSIRILAIERDPDARAAGQHLVDRAGNRLIIAAGRFGHMAHLAAANDFDIVNGVVLDIGVSSMQLDQAERGFSFKSSGPLDMRMERDGPSAADLVAGAEETDLANLVFAFGEERQSRRIAKAIVRAREKAPILTTDALASVVERAIGRRHDDTHHPATRTFQALRIAVNDELGELARALTAAERLLAPGGRLVIVTFHSLEDRIVKRFLARRSGRLGAGSRHGPPSISAGPEPSFRLVNHRPVTPSDAELAANPRSRSAKLRTAIRTGAPAWPPESPAELGLPIVPWLENFLP